MPGSSGCREGSGWGGIGFGRGVDGARRGGILFPLELWPELCLWGVCGWVRPWHRPFGGVVEGGRGGLGGC